MVIVVQNLNSVGYLAVPLAIWQCCQLSGSAADYLTVLLAVLLAINQSFHLSGCAVGNLAMLLAIWQCCRQSGSSATYLAVLPAIWQCYRLSGSAAVSQQAMLPNIRQ